MDQPTDYRPISPLAIVALLLGCSSAVAVFTRFGWFLPLLGTVTAIAALAEVSRPAAPRAGRLAALAGLALAVGFGAQAVTDAVATRWIERTRALATAEAWIDAVHHGRHADALAASTRGILPVIEGPNLEEPADRASRFAALPAVRALQAGRPTVVSARPLGTDDGAWLLRVAVGGRTIALVAVPRKTASGLGPIERWAVASAALES